MAVFLYEKIPASKLKNLLDICTIQLDSTQDICKKDMAKLLSEEITI